MSLEHQSIETFWWKNLCSIQLFWVQVDHAVFDENHTLDYQAFLDSFQVVGRSQQIVWLNSCVYGDENKGLPSGVTKRGWLEKASFQYGFNGKTWENPSIKEGFSIATFDDWRVFHGNEDLNTQHW